MSEKVLVTPAELAAMPPASTVIIDTRNPDAYAAGHIPGAVNVHDIFTHLAMSTPDAISELREKFAASFGKAGLSGAETAVCYEESMNSGFGQSCRGYFLLKFMGYPEARVLHGGLLAWKAAGMEVTTEVAPVEAKSFPLTDAGREMMLDRDDMLAALGQESIVKLDVRDADEWIGESSSPYGPDFCPRKGRIPGSRWIEWYRLMKPSAAGPVFKSRNEILAECASVGVTPASTVYLFCFKGARASNSLVALKEAGITDVRLYFGSWNEWSRDETLPIETGLPFPVAAE